MAWLTAWWEQESALAKLSTTADLLGILGFALSVVVFFLGKSKLREIQEVTEKAQKRLRLALLRVGERLLFSHATNSVRLAQELRNLSRDRRWELAMDRGYQLRSLLVGLRGHSGLEEADRTYLTTAIDDVALILQSCAVGRDDPAHTLPALTAGALDKIIDHLDALDARLKDVMQELEHAKNQSE